MIPPLWKHQAESVAFISARDIAYDASDPGVGKSLVQIRVFSQRRAAGGGRALIVAPLSLMETAWGTDLTKFAPHLTISYAYNTSREAAFNANTDIVAINTDGVKWIDKNLKLINLNEFDTLIIDELTYFKHQTSARSKAMARVSKNFKHRYGLSGTPRTNSITDIWHQMFILDGGQRLGTSFYAFRSQFCVPVEGHFGVTYVDKPNANKLAMHLLKDVVIRHRFDDVMNVPPNYTRTIKYMLPKKLRKQYMELEATSLLELHKNDVTAVNAAALRTKLLQVLSGAVYTDRGYEVLDTSRYELITDLVAERDHTVVFFNFKHQRDALVQQANKRGITNATLDGDTPHKKRAAIVADFQAGNLQAIYIHPATGAHGLTLTRGRATIWASPVYLPDQMKQGLHRIYRGGQTHKTETILIEAVDSVEQAVFARLNTKTKGMMDLLGLIEETQEKRRGNNQDNRV